MRWAGFKAPPRKAAAALLLGWTFVLLVLSSSSQAARTLLQDSSTAVAAEDDGLLADRPFLAANLARNGTLHASSATPAGAAASTNATDAPKFRTALLMRVNRDPTALRNLPRPSRDQARKPPRRVPAPGSDGGRGVRVININGTAAGRSGPRRRVPGNATRDPSASWVLHQGATTTASAANTTPLPPHPAAALGWPGARRGNTTPAALVAHLAHGWQQQRTPGDSAAHNGVTPASKVTAAPSVTTEAAARVAASSQASNRAADSLFSGECIVADSTNGYACLTSPNGQVRLCLDVYGVLSLFNYGCYYGGEGGCRWQWMVPPPTPFLSGTASLCLSGTGRLAVFDGSQELSALYEGPPGQPQGPFAAYVQDDGNFVVYDRQCQRLAETESLAVDMAPPCLKGSPDKRSDTFGLDDGGRAYTDNEFVCPQGSFITQIRAQWTGPFYDTTGIGPLQCSDGTTSAAFGLALALALDDSTAFGYVAVEMAWYNDDTYGSGFSYFGVVKGPQEQGAKAGFGDSYANGGGGLRLECDPGSVVTGLRVRTWSDGSGIARVGVICRPACQVPVSSPEVADCTTGTVMPGQQCSGQCRSSATEGVTGAGVTATCTALGAWTTTDACSADTRFAPQGYAGYAPNSYQAFSFVCEPGTFVTQINGYGGRDIWGIGPVTCSNGYTLPVVFGSSAAPKSWTQRSDAGFIGISISYYSSPSTGYGTLSKVTLRYKNSTVAPSWGGGSTRYGGTADLRCDPGTILAGIHGLASRDYATVAALGIVCRPVCDALATTTNADLLACSSRTSPVGTRCQANACQPGTFGTVTATCSGSRTWTTTNKCQLGCTPATLPPLPVNAAWRCGSVPVGGYCYAECAETYVQAGQAYTQCVGQGSWSAVQGEALCVPTELRVAAPGGRTWLMRTTDDTFFTQPEARAYCQQQGGELLTIASADDTVLLAQLYKTGQLINFYWIGLSLPAGTDGSVSGNWRWLSTNTTPGYTAWATSYGYPFDASRCGFMAVDKGTVVWGNDASCEGRYGGLLQVACQLGCTGAQLPQLANSSWPAGLCDGTAPDGPTCNATCTDGLVPGPDGTPRVTCGSTGQGQPSWTTMQGSCVTPCVLGLTTVTGPAADSVCSTATNKTFTYSITIARPLPYKLSLNVTSTASTGATCKADSGQTVSSGKNFTVTCTRQGAQWPAAGFTVNVTATVEAAGCIDPTSVATLVTRAPSPTATLSGPASARACPLQAVASFNYTFTTLPAGLNLTNVTATSSGPTCSVAPNTAVLPGRTLTVTCNRPTGGWSSFRVNLTATPAGCDATASPPVSTTVSVSQAPTLTRTGAAPAVCSGDGRAVLAYTLTSSSDATFNMVASTNSALVSCTAAPSSATGPATTAVSVTCNRTGASWPAGSFSLTLAAVDRAGCTANVTNTTTVSVTGPPAVTISGPATTPVVCTSAANTTLTFTVGSSGGGSVAVSAASNITGVVCSVASASVAAGANATVVCNRTGALAAFPNAFSVTLTATAGSGTCTNSTSRTIAVATSCCRSGATYARNPTSPTCPLASGCAAGSFLNTITSTTTTTSYSFVAGNCTTFATAGSIPVKCTTSGTSSSFVLGPTNQQATASTVSTYYYAGCTAPSAATKCSPTSFFGGTATCTSATCGVGGSLAAGATATIALQCACTSVRWVVSTAATAPASIVTDRVNGVCL